MYLSKKSNEILIVSIFVLTLILLMPSIPAIQKNVTDNEFKQNIIEKLESIELDDLKNIKKVETIKYPILRAIVLILLDFRLVRGMVLMILATEWDYYGYSPEFKYPIIAIRAFWLAYTANLWLESWWLISETLGWNWPF